MDDVKMLHEYRKIIKKTSDYLHWKNQVVKQLNLEQLSADERNNIFKYYEITLEKYSAINRKDEFKEYIRQICTSLVSLCPIIFSIYILLGNSVVSLMNLLYQKNSINYLDFIDLYRDELSDFFKLIFFEVVIVYSVIIVIMCILSIIVSCIDDYKVIKENYYKDVVYIIKNYNKKYSYNTLNNKETEKDYNDIILQAKENIVKKQHNLLFKYKSLSKIKNEDTGEIEDNLQRTLDIINNKRMYVPFVHQLNDPFEGKFINFYACGNMGTTISKSMGYKNSLLDDMYLKRVLSFSTSATEPLLWAHYAADYSGVCMAFKAEQKFENYKDITYYSDDMRPDICYIKELEQAKEIRNINIYYKNKKWEYEKELRLEYDTSDLKDDKYIEFNQNILIGVIIGKNTSETAKRKVKEACKKNKIVVYKIYIDYFEDKIYILHDEFTPVADGRTIMEQYAMYCEDHLEVKIDIYGDLLNS